MDPTVCVHEQMELLLKVHVDDLAATGPEKALRWLMKELSKHLLIKCSELLTVGSKWETA